MIIAVTNRHLCPRDYLKQIERIARGNPYAVLLREKDLPESEYENLAAQCRMICSKYHVPLIAHHFIEAARRTRIPRIHLPWDDFVECWNKLDGFVQIGVSVHSAAEAVFAAEHGASYLIAGHIFSTDCKKGLTPRGLLFLTDVCRAVPVPVFAIGGISFENAASVLQAGAAGICLMSQFMNCDQL